MATEIEHKYLVDQTLWKDVTPEKSICVKQAYLVTDPDKTIRVRTLGDQGFITIKGKTTGASRLEYEYEIPVNDAVALIERFGGNTIDKVRHYIIFDTKQWEVDEFKGLNQGLWIAEIELEREDEEYSRPPWVGEAVTYDQRYANSTLSKMPFTLWTQK